MKDVTLSTSEVAKELNVSIPTVINYITKGHRTAGKLIAGTKGKDYLINKYDLHLFKIKIRG